MRHLITRQTDWRKWVVPGTLRHRPVHRWLVLPHSFTDDIVYALLSEWELRPGSIVLDPFVGAGTTVLAAKRIGLSAIGIDISPLAALATQVKVADHDACELLEYWEKLRPSVRVYREPVDEGAYPQLVQRALRGERLSTFHHVRQSIDDLGESLLVRRFFLLALLALVPSFSFAVATGGWLSWRDDPLPIECFPQAYTQTVKLMQDDTAQPRTSSSPGYWATAQGDARSLPLNGNSITAVITSPPYPNRHDYTRVFGVELMFGFLGWEATRNLRYQTFHSHPEARPNRPPVTGYVEPSSIGPAIWQIARGRRPRRDIDMLHGYFIDLFLCLREISRVLVPGGHAALIVGNAQYDGVPLEVDIATAEIAEQTGLRCNEIRVVRERGNSAQQMKAHGRSPSRESVVILRKVG